MKSLALRGLDRIREAFRVLLPVVNDFHTSRPLPTIWPAMPAAWVAWMKLWSGWRKPARRMFDFREWR